MNAPATPKTVPRRLCWSALTDRGSVRPNNEDTFLALTFDGHELHYLGKTGEAGLSGADFVFAVSDGMGGAKSGEFASRFAVDRLTRLLPGTFKLSAAGLESGFADILIDLFSSIHRDLLHLGESYDECSGMGATLSLAWVTPGWLYFGHIGDSRIYYLPAAGGLRQLTHDHTHTGWLLRQNRINEREARSHPMRHSLNQVLGAQSQFVDPQVGAVGFDAGDRFLLCTDGLTDGLWDRQLEEMLRTPGPERNGETIAQHLVRESLERSGRDNTTALVIEIETSG